MVLHHIASLLVQFTFFRRSTYNYNYDSFILSSQKSDVLTLPVLRLTPKSIVLLYRQIDHLLVKKLHAFYCTAGFIAVLTTFCQQTPFLAA
jgi:hypothetical protein